MSRRQWNDGMELIYQDLSAISSALERELYDRVIYELMNRQQNVVFGDSFTVSRVNSTTVQVKAGNGIQVDNTQVTPEPKARLLYVASDTNKTITTADATQNRIDIVCIKQNRATETTASRNTKDASTGVVTATSQVVQTDWASDLTVVAGTPSGSPAVPATPSGYIKLAEVLVTATTGVVNSAAITDKRPRFQKPTGWQAVKAVTAAYTADNDDEIITADTTGVAFTITFPAAATCSGKTWTIINKVATNNLTLQGNGSELISDSNTQTVSSALTVLKVTSDGTQLYLT